MYPDVPLWLAVAFVVGGLLALAWSANRFVDGASSVARLLGASPFIIGMVVIGFGTSAPELAVSTISGWAGHSNLSLGNAYGSNIFNIAVILGVAALVRPLAVRPVVSFVAVPLLICVSLLSGLLVCVGKEFSRMDGVVALAAFGVLLPAYCWFDKVAKAKESVTDETEEVATAHPWLLLLGALMLLVGSSHVLVWGAVDLARALGVSELLIGLTVVAAGTSLPELASAVAAARKGRHDFVFGNIIGSNFFNTLAVVGLSGAICPFREVSPHVLTRDLGVMVLLTLSIGLFGMNFRDAKRDGRICRLEAVFWLLSFAVYLTFLLHQEVTRMDF